MKKKFNAWKFLLSIEKIQKQTTAKYFFLFSENDRQGRLG